MASFSERDPVGDHLILDETATALDRAGQFLSAHVAGAERVTGERKAQRKLSS